MKKVEVETEGFSVLVPERDKDRLELLDAFADHGIADSRSLIKPIHGTIRFSEEPGFEEDGSIKALFDDGTDQGKKDLWFWLTVWGDDGRKYPRWGFSQDLEKSSVWEV